ncbi:TetR/AcrR family transcriptional regulator [Kutzneria buriramensis]|uniref:DNA-binding transcriptional regulator YbjK n=1 Tax=Kutzneria buriramensis TaxID=1045776 RepID=A0A3E0I8X6_9PSEU|nr:TetR family transcriptional regulator [Kutzneria buriramensis]REH55079.1 DNA-binding transcriptional regulator YbjK [Kutzneria buriramensis]
MTAASTPKGERRRHELVAAAAALLTEGGFDAVRHRAVAERAGLPLASTTYYFDSLDELVEAAVEHNGRAELDAGRARLAELQAGEPMDVIEFALDLLVKDSDTQAVLLRYERLVGTARRPYLQPLMRRMGVELQQLLLDLLTAGGFAMTPERVDQLIAVVDGAVVNALIEVHPDPRAAARRMLLSVMPDLANH